jgi:hypothetical protein
MVMVSSRRVDWEVTIKMKDRSYAIAIVVILAICCLGAYVAVSGYLNSQSPLIAVATPGTPPVAAVTVLPTDLPVPSKAAVVAPVVVPASPVAAPSPLGIFQTITAAVTAPPTAPIPATAPRVTVPPTAAEPAQLACGNFGFCPRTGPGDASLAPGGNDCPANYIWGRVVDSGGKGLANVRIRYRSPTGDSDVTVTKAPPDPAGVFNIPTGQPGSTWTVWLEVNNSQVSPQVPVTTQRPTTTIGLTVCPTRIDFVQK